MNKLSSTLTVYFENPFWVGIIERRENDSFKICKVNFGSSEPKDYDVYEFLNDNWFDLHFSDYFKDENKVKSIKNPKRLQREVNKLLSKKGIETKSQEALKDQYLENKKLSKKINSENLKLEKEKKYLIKKNKRKLKKKGH